jgi:hypothetical protein
MDNEKTTFNNSFGTVSNKRIIVKYKNGSEDIPIKLISSVSFARKQRTSLALFYLLIGAGVLIGTFNITPLSMGAIIVGLLFFIFCILIGAAYYIGNHQIKLGASGQNRKPIKVEMSKTKEGKEFSEAIRRQIISS